MKFQQGQIVVSTADTNKAVAKKGEYGIVMHANNTLAIVYWSKAGRCVKQFLKNPSFARVDFPESYHVNINRKEADSAYVQYKNDTKPGKRKQEQEGEDNQPSLNTPMGFAVALMRDELSPRELLSMHDGLASSEQLYLKHVETVTGEPRGSATIFNAKRLLKTTLRSQEISEINAEIQRLEQLKVQLAND